MFKFAVIVCVGMGWLSASAQTGTRAANLADFRNAANSPIHSSLSGQFVIREAPNAGGNPVPIGNHPNVRYVRLDPTLLTVSCERIKHALLAELDTPDKWRDKIYIDLQHARTLNDTIVIHTSPYGHNWNYHVSLPDTLENTRVVTTIVDILLLEMANRHSDRAAEIPAWLGYGVCQDLMRSSHIEMVLEPAQPVSLGLNISVMTVMGTNTNSLAIAHEDLRTSPPLTLEQLSWPDAAQLDGAAGGTFRSSAQLFVHELLQLKNGHAAFRAFIDELPQHLNWQLSFLHAFHGDFANQLDLEKWWALRLVDFTGRDVTQTWSAEESWKKLNEIIHPFVEIRTRADELPLRTEISLQRIIEQWELPKQTGLLRDKSQDLYKLRSRASQEVAKLVDDYRRTIDVYLTKRTREAYLRSAKARELFGPDKTTQQALDELDILDGICEDLRPKPPSLQSANVNQVPNN